MGKVVLIVFMILSVQLVVFGQQTKIMAKNHKKVTIEQSISNSDKWLANDKLQHFILSGFFTAYGYVFLQSAFKSPEDSAVLISTAGMTGLGITKEIYDLKSKKGHPSFKDILANMLGIGTALFFVKIL